MQDNDPGSRIDIFGEKNLALYLAQSDANGSFAIGDVPATLGLVFTVEHPAYALKNGRGISPTIEAALELAPGGSLRGRVLDVAGKPIAGAAVGAYSMQPGAGGYLGGNVGRADGNGIFTIGSLAPGAYTVSASVELLDNRAPFLFPRVMNVPVEAGKTLDSPDIRAQSGVMIRGMVRDAASQKPLAGASLIASANNETAGSGVSDAAGRFAVRVMPGNYQFYVSGPPSGYARPNEMREVVAGQAAPLVFDLQKVALLRGILVDEAGTPVQARLNVGFRGSIQSDAQGRWQYQPQDNQAVALSGGEAEDGYFDIVSPLAIEVGTGRPTTIVVRKSPWQVLSGRALTTDGKPLAGVAIEARFPVPLGNGFSIESLPRTAITNANGDFVLSKIRGDVRTGSTLSGTKKGFAFQSGGQLSKNGPVWQVADLLFAPLNSQIEGKTAPGARVTAGGLEKRADATGHFQFEGLTAGENRVWALQGSNFGGAEGASPLQIELKPQGLQARDVDLAREIWNDIIAESKRDPKGPIYYGLGSVQWQLIAAKNADSNTVFDAQVNAETNEPGLYALVSRFAGKVDLKAFEAAILRLKDPDWRAAAYLDAAAKYNDSAFTARALQAAESAFQTPENQLYWRETNLYQFAVVTEKSLGDKAGFAALDRAVAFTLKNHGPKTTRQNGQVVQTGRDEVLARQAEVVASGGAALFGRLLQNIEPGAGFDAMALAGAIPALATVDGAQSVLPLLDELEKLPEPPVEGWSRLVTQSPRGAFATAAVKIVPLLGASSPQQALDLARRVRAEKFGSRLKWQALAGAARFQNAATAAPLWREIVAGADAATAPRFAARAFEFDPKLGRELFEVARLKVEAQSSDERTSPKPWAAWAFYAARGDAAPVRFTLEREWGRARSRQTGNWQLGELAWAMSATDARRAWEMAREIPADTFFASLEARRKIGVFLAAPEETRQDFPFDISNDFREWREIEAQ